MSFKEYTHIHTRHLFHCHLQDMCGFLFWFNVETAKYNEKIMILLHVLLGGFTSKQVIILTFHESLMKLTTHLQLKFVLFLLLLLPFRWIM